MKKLYALITLLVFLFTASSAMALDPEPIFDLQDDFTIEFNYQKEIGDPEYETSVISTLNAHGDLLFSGTKDIAGMFEIKNSISNERIDLGDKWQLNFSSGSFKINKDPLLGGELLWEGNISNLTLIYSKDFSEFLIPLEYIPAIDAQIYEGYGTGLFTKPIPTPANELWDIEAFDLSKMGMYNMRGITVDDELLYVRGNMQGNIYVVPEPGTVAAMLTGLAGLGISVLRRKK